MQKSLPLYALCFAVLIAGCESTTSPPSSLRATNFLVGEFLIQPEVRITAGQRSITLPARFRISLQLSRRLSDAFNTGGKPISGAKVEVRSTTIADASILLSEDTTTPGTYRNVGDSSFAYKADDTYAVEATIDGELHQLTVSAAPDIERIAVLHPANGIISHTANTALTLERPLSAEVGGYVPAIWSVYPIVDAKQAEVPTDSNRPPQLLTLAQLPKDWQTTNVTIPGKAFPNAASQYAVVFYALKPQTSMTPNLFIGSLFVIGVADVGILETPK